MPQSIKLSTDQMRLMSLFQNVTKATARDCVEDETQDKIIFVVQEGKMGLAIGKGGSNSFAMARLFFCFRFHKYIHRSTSNWYLASNYYIFSNSFQFFNLS